MAKKDDFATARKKMADETKKIAKVIFENLDGEISPEQVAREKELEKRNAAILEELYIKTGQKKAPKKQLSYAL